jgi:pimeloyl-ACP methyl ester carboxylesterase
MKIEVNEVILDYEDTHYREANCQRPVVLLIMGLGMQWVAWPRDFVKGLVDAGYRVVRHDNRDAGLSTQFEDLPTPSLFWQTLKYQWGLQPHAVYSIKDMAEDSLRLMAALGISKFHVVGASMGGMIAQRMALLAPQRLMSLTSMLSSSSARGLPGPQARVIRALLAKPAGKKHSDIEEQQLNVYRSLASTDFKFDENAARATINQSLHRGGYHHGGTQRQLAAILADRSRAKELQKITTPTLVMHGCADPFVPYACGLDTAKRIPGATMVGVRGWGHDLPEAVLPHVLPPLLAHLRITTLQHTSPPEPAANEDLCNKAIPQAA